MAMDVIDTGCVVAFQPTVDFDIQYVGKIKSAPFGGEGLFFATLSGRGRSGCSRCRSRASRTASSSRPPPRAGARPSRARCSAAWRSEVSSAATSEAVPRASTAAGSDGPGSSGSGSASSCCCPVVLLLAFLAFLARSDVVARWSVDRIPPRAGGEARRHRARRGAGTDEACREARLDAAVPGLGGGEAGRDARPSGCASRAWRSTRAGTSMCGAS